MSKKKFFISVGVFILIGAILFGIIQNVLAQTWNRPYFAENLTSSLRTFYSQEDNVDQVLFLGTSHSEYSVSPMEIYEDSGIVSYNLSTSGQSIEVTYYLLRSALERQLPKVVVLDASSLFFDDDIDIKNWRYVLDEMPMGKTKIAMARKYAKLINNTSVFSIDCEKDFVNALVPIFEYHTRWSELTYRDFMDVWDNDSYVTAGYFMNTYRNGSMSIDEMNSIADTLEQSGVAYEYLFGSDNKNIDDSDVLYASAISDTKYGYLEEIKKMCDDNGITLVLAKYPSIYNPILYSSAWTLERSNMTRVIAERLGVGYLDFVYDIDFGFNTDTDFADSGKHLNYCGAKKVSLYLSNYLSSEYDIEGTKYDMYEENRTIYDKLTEIADVQLSDKCSDLMNYIVDNKEKYIICIAASDDMCVGLGDEEITALQKLGLKTDYQNDMSYGDSYIAIIEQGNVLFEKMANRKISYEDWIGEDNADINVKIISSGYLTGADSEIYVNGKDYAVNNRGINIVLIDKETSCVVISKCIDTYIPEEHYVSSGDNVVMLQDYWEELLK